MKKIAVLFLILFAPMAQAHNWPAILTDGDEHEITLVVPSGAWCRGLECNSSEMKSRGIAALRAKYCINTMCVPPNGHGFEIHVGMYEYEDYRGEYHMLFRMIKGVPQAGYDTFQLVGYHVDLQYIYKCEDDGWSWSLGMDTIFDYSDLH